MGTDVAETQHGGTVTDNTHQVTAVGVTACHRCIIGNLHAGHGHAGRIGQSQVIDGETGLAGQHFQLTGTRLLMVLKSSFS